MTSVRQEIKQGRPFVSPAQEAVVALLRRADQLRGSLGEVVEPAGITLQQYNVLRILRGAGPLGLPTLEIAARMIEHSPGITRLLDRLEAKQLVVRVPCSHDRRRVLCRASARALRLLAAVDAPLSRATTECLAALDDHDQRVLVRLLDAIQPVARGEADPEQSLAKETRA
jgi:DNA-binding MarR family transcriptional regulator